MAPPQASLARNSLYKLLSSSGRLLLGLVIGVMTARWLGPYDKGTLSTLLFAGHVILFYVCGLGLGEATTVLVGRGKFSLQRAVSGSLGLLMPACAAGVGGLWILSILADWSAISSPIVLTAVGLVVWVHLSFLLGVLNVEERFLVTGAIAVLMVSATAFFTWVLVGLLGRGLTGATAAVCLGFAAAFVVALVATRSSGIRFRPRWDPQFGASAVRLGAGMGASFLLIAVSQRFDQLVVYSIAGPSQAGQYSVALTVGQLVAFIPSAMSSASFPRLARLGMAEVVPFTQMLTRVGLITSMICGVLFVFLIPVLIPSVWGQTYHGAVGPAQVLVPGGILGSAQWILARAAAARGRTALLLWSFGINLIVMLVLDLALIGPFGTIGAAVASSLGSLAGLGVCLFDYNRRGHVLTRLIPTLADLRALSGSIPELWRR